MRVLVPAVLFSLLLVPASLAQPADGNVVLSVLFDQNNAFDQGRVVYFDPGNPSVLTTLASQNVKGYFHNWVRMAPGNLDLVVSEEAATAMVTRLINFDPGGRSTTLAAVPGAIDGFELDGDNLWAAVSDHRLLGIDHATGSVTTLVNAPGRTFNEVAIVREGGVMYALADFAVATTVQTAKVLAGSRNGITGTIFQSTGNPLLYLSGIETDPRRGSLLVSDFDGPPNEPWGTEVSRVTLNGKVNTLVSFWGANAIKIAQDDTAWVAGFVGTPSQLDNAVLHYDLSRRTVLSIYRLPQISAALWSISGIELYGSRVLTCWGQGGPGQFIRIDIHSRNPRAVGASYQVACSFGRRPGLRLPTGEWLHLNVTDSLFFLSARNLVPTLFRNFNRTLSASGGARALIQLPQGFPVGLGITVFCAAVIYDSKGIVQVSNTHWFEL